MNKFTRKANRLPIPEIYKSNNSFFVTICVRDRVCCLSEINNGKTKPSPIGSLVNQAWLQLVEVFTNIHLEDFVIMPNHVHGIITFLDIPVRRSNGKSIDLSEIIGYFKAFSQKLVREKIVEEGLSLHNEKWRYKIASTDFDLNKFWQKSFYDHVIRNEKDLLRIQEYILTNPLKWEIDSLNPRNITVNS
jgi:putative transposase